MTLRLSAVLTSALSAILCAEAQSAVTPQRFSDLTSEIRSIQSVYRENNPASFLLIDSLSVSSASVKGEWALSDKAYKVQEGKGTTGLSLSAGSYQRLGSRSAVWGEAGFSTAMLRDVKWCDCLDYEKVAPYILGDEVGGDLSTRRYSFSGGYASTFSNWLIGVRGAYRAEIGYRNRDPRLKSIVSDLDISAGVGYRMTDEYFLGLSAGLDIYRQNCDLDFYNPVNDINTFTLTGLGSFYSRFMGNTNKNSGYESTGASVAVQWQPAGDEGLFFLLDCSTYKMEQRLRNFNNLTLGFKNNSTINVSAAYTLRVSAVKLSPAASFRHFSAKGTENIFGTAEGSSYEKIGSRSPYRHTVDAASLIVPIEYRKGASLYSLSASLGYFSERERLSIPLRKVSATHIIPGLSIGCKQLLSRSWMLEGRIRGELSREISTATLLEDLPDNALGAATRSNAEMLQADRATGEIMLGIIRFLRGGTALRMELTSGVCRYRSLATGRSAGLSIGVIF